MNNNQRDARWANIPVGFGDQTIGQVGCTISVIGDILGLTPPEVNEALKKVNGFANGNLVIWSKIEEAFPGVQVTRVWTYDNDDVLHNIPNVIVEVPATPIGGRGSHWVRYIGNHQLDDPWTGITRPTSDFPNPTGFCVIIPNQTVPIPVPSTYPVMNDQTKYDFGGTIGIQEMGAIRSMLNDTFKEINDLQEIVDARNKTIKDLLESNKPSSIPPSNIPSGFLARLIWLFQG